MLAAWSTLTFMELTPNPPVVMNLSVRQIQNCNHLANPSDIYRKCVEVPYLNKPLTLAVQFAIQGFTQQSPKLPNSGKTNK